MKEFLRLKIENFSPPMREKVKMNQELTILKIKTTTKKAILTLIVIQKVASQLFRFSHLVLKKHLLRIIFSQSYNRRITRGAMESAILYF